MSWDFYESAFEDEAFFAALHGLNYLTLDGISYYQKIKLGASGDDAL